MDASQRLPCLFAGRRTVLFTTLVPIDARSARLVAAAPGFGGSGNHSRAIPGRANADVAAWARQHYIPSPVAPRARTGRPERPLMEIPALGGQQARPATWSRT